MRKKTPWLFIDLDGTLINNISTLREVFFQFGEDIGIKLTEDDFKNCNGPSLREIVIYIRNKSHSTHSPARLEKLYTEKLEKMYRGFRPRKDARSVLRKLRSRGWRCALVTSAPKSCAINFLKNNNMYNLFDFVVSGDETPCAKPDPAIYKLAKKRAGNGYFVALEDSLLGISAAQRANCLALSFVADSSAFFSVSSFLELSQRLYIVGDTPILMGYPARARFTVKTQTASDVLNLDTRMHRVADAFWRKSKSKDDKLFDGNALVVSNEKPPYNFTGSFVPFRYVYYQLKKKKYLGIMPCGVTGIVKHKEKLVVMRRGREGAYQGIYEFAPSGVIDSGALVGKNRVDIKKQLLRELQEELSISASSVRSLSFYCLVLDIAYHVLDVVYLVTLKDNARPAMGYEHTEINMFSLAKLRRVVLQNSNKFFPFVSLFAAGHTSLNKRQESKSVKVVLLGSHNEECRKLKDYFLSQGEEVLFLTDRISPGLVREFSPDIIVSYNSRFILSRDIFNFPRIGTINLHVSYLPWNRGSDPNFWSHIENTPKGVTLHYIDKGIDTGDIIAQELVEFSKDETLKTSYEKLHEKMQLLFYNLWPSIKNGNAPRIKQGSGGTFHLQKDREPLNYLLEEKGWDTPTKKLSKLDLKHKDSHNK